MPITSTAEARNVMNKMALDNIVAGTVQFVGDEKLTAPTGDQDWCRVQITHVTGGQETLANFNGVRRYNRTGTIIVQCFAPLANQGFSRAEALAEQAVKTFEGKSGAGGIWFRNVRSSEVGAADGWFQFNAVAEFDYSIKR